MTRALEQDYYTVQEAARALKVSRTTIWRWIARGHLKALRIASGTTRIRREDLEALLKPARDGTKAGKSLQERRERVQVADENDIWAGYDPDKVREGLRKAAGALAGVDREELLRDIYAEREQDSKGRPA